MLLLPLRSRDLRNDSAIKKYYSRDERSLVKTTERNLSASRAFRFGYGPKAMKLLKNYAMASSSSDYVRWNFRSDFSEKRDTSRACCVKRAVKRGSQNVPHPARATNYSLPRRYWTKKNRSRWMISSPRLFSRGSGQRTRKNKRRRSRENTLRKEKHK